MTARITIINIAILGLIALAVYPNFADARTVVRSGDTISINQDELIEGDLYTAANIVHVSGQIEEDFLAVGAEVNMNGQVGKDSLIIGGNVDVHGTVGDDLRIVGGSVIIAEPVLGDVFVIGGTIKILSSASITGDLTVIGSSVEVNGSVGGQVLGWADTVRIDSEVKGDVDITTTNLTLGDKANIAGNVSYVSQQQLVRSQSANVGGEVVRNDPVIESTETSPFALLLPLLVLLFSVAVWYLLSRRMLQRVTNRALVPGIRPVLIGGLTLLLAPFAISILLVSMLGFLAGLVLLAVYVLFFTLAVIAIPSVIGQLVMVAIRKDITPVSLSTLLVGTVITGLVILVPVIGPIILLGFLILTFGSLVDLLIRSNR